MQKRNRKIQKNFSVDLRPIFSIHIRMYTGLIIAAIFILAGFLAFKYLTTPEGGGHDDH